MQAVWDSTPGDDYLQHMLWYDWQYTLSDNDLRKVETMSAAAGIRVSYPMLDDGLVERHRERTELDHAQHPPGADERDRRALDAVAPSQRPHTSRLAAVYRRGSLTPNPPVS